MSITYIQAYMGRLLRVNFSDKPKPKGLLYPDSEYELYVSNLSWSVTSESLAQAFQEYGNVVGARVIYDDETGKSRGYGFVSYSTKSEMETALEACNELVRVFLSSYVSFCSHCYYITSFRVAQLCLFFRVLRNLKAG